MKQSDLYKILNKKFQDEWTECPIKFDTRSSLDDSKTEHIFIKYIPLSSSRRYIGDKEEGVQKNGTLRVFAYAKNPLRAMSILDEVEVFISDYCKDGVKVAEVGTIISSVDLDNITGLYFSAVDFYVYGISGPVW